MVNLRRASILSVLVTALCGNWVGAAQAQQAPVKNPRLSLSIGAGTGGVESELQLKLTVPPGLQIGKVEAVVTFPADVLTLDRVSGYLVEQGKMKAETKTQESKDGLRAVLLSLQPTAPDTPLPPDTTANIVFKIAEGVKPGVLDVGLQAKVFGRDGREISPVDVYPGRINLQETDLFFGCFFYMH